MTTRYWSQLVGLGLFAFAMIASMNTASAQSSFGLGLGFSYNSGGGFGGYPGYGYGGGFGGGYYGGGTGCFNSPMLNMPPGGMMGYNGGMGGMGMGGMGMGMPMSPGMFMPAMPPLRAPAPFIPPHLAQGNMGWGPGFGSFPGPGYGMGGGACGACMGGYPQMPMGPVAGGPAIMGPCGSLYGTCGMQGGMPGGYLQGGGGGGYVQGGGAIAGGSNGISSINGNLVIDMRSRNAWEVPDTGEIVWATALGLGMQATNVYPVAVPRYQPTYIGSPTLFNTGGRDYDFYARPHGP